MTKFYKFLENFSIFGVGEGGGAPQYCLKTLYSLFLPTPKIKNSENFAFFSNFLNNFQVSSFFGLIRPSR